MPLLEYIYILTWADRQISAKGWVAQGREIFDQDEEGNIAGLEVGKDTLSLENFRSKQARLNAWICVKVRETFDLKNISPAGKFPDQTCPGLRCMENLKA